MTVVYSSLDEQTKTHLGILSELPPSMPTPFYDMWKNAPVVTGNATTKKLKWSWYLRKVIVAMLIEKGSTLPGLDKVKDNEWREAEIEPGETVALQSITAAELTALQPNGTDTFMIGGQQIKTSDQLAVEKYQFIKDAIVRRYEIMCAQLIKDGVVHFSDGKSSYDFQIPAAEKVTYSATQGFLKLVKTALVKYKKRNGMVPDKFLIGSDIVDAILMDKDLQETMKNLNFTNVAKDVLVNNFALIVGTFMGQVLEQLDITFDEKGVEIMPGNQIKLLNTKQFKRGYAAIPVMNPATKIPDHWLGDFWTSIKVGDDLNPQSTLIGKGGFFPIVVDPATIYTLEVTIEK